jgi:cysteinyl-tRNA synthetase
MPDPSGKVPWCEWSDASREPVHWPTDVGSRVRSLAALRAVEAMPTLRIGSKRVPVLERARVYVCGITPYDTTHLGHAATFVWADLAARTFRLTGAEVDMCRNVTDVDDHLLQQARERGVAWRALATEQSYRFERDMTQLGLVQPTYEPRSFDHVDEVVSLASELLAIGAAYVRRGNVYFKGAGVAESAGMRREEAIALARERGGHPDDPDKEDPLDTVLWQRSESDEPAWPSPWGEGRPGWHAECTAMALATFGPSVDLHAGGADLGFPHHAYEAAQAESYTGVVPFARSWLRVGTVMVSGEKMAKSAGNLVFVHDLLERNGPAALRLLILERRWREPWEYDESNLDDAEARVDELQGASSRRARDEHAGKEIVRALLEDLDVPRALEVAADCGGEPLRHLMRFLGLS